MRLVREAGPSGLPAQVASAAVPAEQVTVVPERVRRSVNESVRKFQHTEQLPHWTLIPGQLSEMQGGGWQVLSNTCDSDEYPAVDASMSPNEVTVCPCEHEPLMPG